MVDWDGEFRTCTNKSCELCKYHGYSKNNSRPQLVWTATSDLNIRSTGSGSRSQAIVQGLAKGLGSKPGYVSHTLPVRESAMDFYDSMNFS